MRSWLLLAFAALAGCSASSTDTTTKPGGDASADVAAPDDAGDDAGPTDAGTADAPTWTFVYATYFGSGTPGHCGNAGCHLGIQGGFSCGSTKATCYEGLSVNGFIDPQSPASSPLVDPNASPLAWFGGNMPQDQPVPNAAAARDVKAWVLAGAKNN